MMIPPTPSWALGHPEKRGLCLSSLGVCGGCGKRAKKLKRCSRCKGESYCGTDCQRRGWRDGHKAACEVLCRTPVAGTDFPTLAAALDRLRAADASREAIALAAVDPPGGEGEGAKLFSGGYDLVSGKVGYLDAFARGETENLASGPSDEEKGYHLIRRAADLGHKGAQYAVALEYLEGGYFATNENGGDADKTNMLKFLKLAANNGHAEAQKTYGASYWYEGRDGHEVDMLQAVTWVRRALAHGVSESEGPDPRGDALSRRSFEGSVKDAVEMGRKLYLEKFPSYADGDDESLEYMRIAADCGMFPAISICAVDGKNELEDAEG